MENPQYLMPLPWAEPIREHPTRVHAEHLIGSFLLESPGTLLELTPPLQVWGEAPGEFAFHAGFWVNVCCIIKGYKLTLAVPRQY